MQHILLFLLLTSFTSFLGYGQIYSLTGNLGTINTCTGTFYDSG